LNGAIKKEKERTGLFDLIWSSDRCASFHPKISNVLKVQLLG
jgi:hypothetical protein